MAPRPMVVHPVHGYKIRPQEDIKTIKRNQRERSRVQTVNLGFDTLKQHLPGTAHLKKVLCVARHARYDLLCPIPKLASCVTNWAPANDRQLHRLMCYINTTLNVSI